MLLGDQSVGIPRIGEIVVVTCSHSNHWSFLRTVCDNCEMTNQQVVLGQTKINDELYLYLYGINANGDIQDFAWDLIVNKMLGYIVLFDWYDYDTFAHTLKTIDFLTERIDAPLVVAADVHDQNLPIAPTMFEYGIPISPQGRFSFCSSGDRKSVMAILRTLVEMLIDRAM